jgi:hypothetical protein
MDAPIEPPWMVYGVTCMSLHTRAMQEQSTRRSARF